MADALARIDTELFEADWAEARTRVGDGVCAGDLVRTPAQRRADALVEMARRAMAAVPGSRLLVEPARHPTVALQGETALHHGVTWSISHSPAGLSQ